MAAYVKPTKDFNSPFLPHNPNSPDTVVNRPVPSSSLVRFKDNNIGLTVHNITQLWELKVTLLQSNKDQLANTVQGENRELEETE